MPLDAVSTWVRGRTLFVRFPRSHTVRLPVDRPDLLVRVLRTRAVVAASMLNSDKQHDTLPMAGFMQADIDTWLHAGNKPKQLPTASAITHAIVETSQDRRDKAHWEMQKLLAEY